MGGLILAAALLLMNKENFVDFGWGENNISVIICIITFIALYFFKVNPMILITIAGIAGAIIY
jgi:chromate transporter